MRALTLLSLLLFFYAVSGSDELLDDDDDNSDGELDESNLAPRGFGERCSKKVPCAEGLDCFRMPIRKRCMPVTCGVEAVRTSLAQTNFDLKNYGQDMMNKAGVSQNSSMFRAFPDAQLNLFDTNSEDMKRLTVTIQEYQPPLDLIVANFNNCTRGSTMGVTPYFGLSWELGLLGTYNGDLFWGQGKQPM